MKRCILALLTVCFANAALAASPIAEVLCEPTSALHDKLTHQFGAERRASGIRDPEQIMEVWTDRRGGWTLVATYASGTSCIVAMGADWATHPVKDPA